MATKRANAKPTNAKAAATKPRSKKRKTILDQIAENKIQQSPKLLLGMHKSTITELPVELFELTHLRELTIVSLAIKDIPNDFLKLASLQKVQIYGSEIDEFPTQLMLLPNLKELSFQSSTLTELPARLTQWKTIDYLNINGCGNLSAVNGLPKNLTYLNISSTALKEIPKAISYCQNLTKIVATELRLTTLPDELYELPVLLSLFIGENRFTQLPAELLRLTYLLELVASHNLLTEYPDYLTQFKFLHTLNLEGNLLSDLPASFENLQNLRELDLGSNDFSDFPTALLNLTELDTLEFNNISFRRAANKNRISHIPPGIIKLIHLKNLDLRGNSITNVPAEIIEQGPEAIRSYFIQLENHPQDYLFEAKLLILGEPGAGKTSLTWKLEDSNCALPAPNATTRGVDVRQYFFSINAADFPDAIKLGEDRQFRLNLWDFGGQEIYKATHRFFLSDQAVYVLVADSRNEDTDFAYWLHIQEIFGSKSPVLIIINERDDRRRDLDEKEWKRLFGNIKDVLVVNLKDRSKQRLTRIKSLVRSLAVGLPHVGNPVPATWTIIRDALEADLRHQIDAREYFDLCQANGIPDAKDARILSKYFHDIGVFLHFQEDELLKHKIFLKPTWATNAVYKVLDHPLLLKNNGRFSRHEASTIWHEDQFAQVQDELLKLMQKFFLTYKISDSAGYIVPEQLPSNRPDYAWDDTDNLVLEYKYEYFMPKGIITQFIVQQHRYITNHELVWRRGVVLERRDTFAEVVETYVTRTIKVRIIGKNKRDFMTLITEALDGINEHYANLKVEKFIPCNCIQCAVAEQPHAYEYSDLQTRIEKNKRTIECRVSYEDVGVHELMAEVFNPAILVQSKQPELAAMIKTKNAENTNVIGKGKIFVSYAHKNVKLLDELLIHFDTLKYAGIAVDVWSDKRIEGGMHWKEEINRAMDECQVAILLVSAPFLASKFIMTEELPTILAAAKGRGVTLLCIVAGVCRFTETPFLKEYQTMNEPGKPLSTLRPAQRDKVYTKVLDRVTALLPS